ncbi:MAG: autotransporter domain-containing protein [Rhizobiales bacterium]|nr:autotransporter domain-containing protein [Hyphomicrobiales bacterium]
MGLGLTSEALHGQMALGHGSAKDDEGPLRPRSSLAGWARGYGDVSRLDSDGNAAQAESTSGGLMGGVDTLVAPGTRIGLMAHWGRTDGDAEARLSNYDIETASIAAYGGIVIGNIHLKALAGYSSHDIETSRNIVFPGIARTATAGYDADQISLYGEAAYLMDMGHLALMPMIAVRWADVDVEGFTEQGAGAANLTVAAQSYDTLDTIVGLRIAGTYRSEGMTVMPQARIGWVHTSGDIAPLVPLTLAGGGGTFTVAGARRAEDALAVGVGVNVAFDDALTGFVDYGANLSDEATDQAVSAGFRWRF